MDRDPQPEVQGSTGMLGTYPCPSCARTTSHSVLTIVNSRDFDCGGLVFFINHYLTVKCNGCGTISFCHISKFSEDEDYDDQGCPFLIPHSKHYPELSDSQVRPEETFVESARLEELANIPSKQHDLARLLQLLSELERAYKANSYLSCILLIRTILDHVPPIFGQKSFAEVANNYSGAGRSFRESMMHLHNSSRKIADSYLHTQIRAKESLPTKTQVEFRADIDVLLAEINRVLQPLP